SDLHVGDRDATVFRDHKRLSFSGEAGHFGNDRFFLTAIKTQGLLLKMHTSENPSYALLLQRPTVEEIHPSAAGSPSALAHSGLSTAVHQRSWMACGSRQDARPQPTTSDRFENR